MIEKCLITPYWNTSKCSKWKKTLACFYWGCPSPSFPSFHIIFLRNRKGFFACQLVLHEQSYSSFFSEGKKSAQTLDYYLPEGQKGNKTNHTKKNKTKRMNFHTFDVHCLKWGVFWWEMRSYQGRISPSLKSPEVAMTKSSFSFLPLPLLQPAYALSSWKNK